MLTLALALALLGTQAETTAKDAASPSVTFRKIVVDKAFRSEGIAVADVNRDGRPDLIAGNLWYAAPDWTPREIAPVQTFDPATGYSNSFLNFAQDVNKDGWTDQILISMPGEKAVWRENPKGQPGHWREHPLWRNACNESPAFADLLGPRKPALVFAYDEKFMAWFEPNLDLTKEFRCHTVSAAGGPGTGRFTHGLGVGDINGDGRADILCTEGYYEAPQDRRSVPWKFVPAKLGEPCAQMYVYDVNGDGLPDVISSSAHGVGVWWHEQRRGPNGPEFITHTIDASFSQSHALQMADINGDGQPDLVTGKRFWAHGPNGDIAPNAPAVLVWFSWERKNRSVLWTRHLIDNDSGVGTQFVVADINKDGLPDIAVANKKGVFCFLQARQ
jgi:hypothetical protein